MKRLIPGFIYEQYLNNCKGGSFYAAALSVDISGFTALTEMLARFGTSGAEELSSILGSAFGPIIEEIHKNGGFIPFFAGDGFVALFPEGAGFAQCALKTAFFIKRNTTGNSSHTRFGTFSTPIRVGIATGEVHWGIYGNEKLHSYVFSGSLFNKAGEAQGNDSGTVCVSDAFLKHIPEYEHHFTKGAEFYSTPPFPVNIRIKSPALIKMQKSILNTFVSDDVLVPLNFAEFRKVVSVFLQFSPADSPQKYAAELIEKTVMFGGYFNKLYHSKTVTALILFGAPTSYENNFERAADFILALKQSVKFKAALTSGTVYAGIVGNDIRCEYTAIGDSVNLAARLCDHAGYGECIVDSAVYSVLNSSYNLEETGEHTVKGKTSPVKTFCLDGKKDIDELFYRNSFFGMSHELNSLFSFLKPAGEGKFSGAAYVRGEAGSGKSRLVHECMNQHLMQHFCRWFFCQTDEILRRPFNPFRYFLKNYFQQFSAMAEEHRKQSFMRITDSLIKRLKTHYHLHKEASEIAGELERTRTFLGILCDLHFEGSISEKISAELRFQNTVSAFINLIKAECLNSPVILVIEDIHWLDEDSRTLCSELLKSLEKYPFALIATSRPLSGGSFSKLLYTGRHTIIETERLGRNDVKGLASEIAGRTVPDSVAEAIQEKTGGNPFFVEQIVMHCIESRGAQSILEKDVFMQQMLPETIDSVLISRLDKLSAEVRAVVQAAAVLGREFEMRILTEMMHSDETVETKVRQAEEQKIWSAVNEIKYIFRHSLLRDSAYNMQMKSRLRDLHRLAAASILKVCRHDLESYWENLAYHFEHADELSKAAEYYKKSAEHSVKGYETAKAVYLFDRLIAIQKKQTKSLELCESYLARGRVYRITGQWDLAETDYKNALEIADSEKQMLLIARCYDETGDILRKRGDNDTAMTYFGKALDIYKKEKNYKGIAGEYLSMSGVFERRGDYENASEYLEQALKLSVENNFPDIETRILYDLGILEFRLGEYESAIKRFTWQLEKNNDLRMQAAANANIGTIYLVMQQFSESKPYMYEALRLNREAGDENTAALVMGNIAIIHIYEGQYNEAKKLLKRQLEINTRTGYKEGLANAYGNLGEIYMRQGEYQASIKCYKKALLFNREIGDRRAAAMAELSMAEVYRRNSDKGKAVLFYNSAAEKLSEIDALSDLCQALFGRAELFFDEDAEKAEHYFSECYGVAVSAGDLEIQQQCEIMLEVISAFRNRCCKALELYLKQSLAEKSRVLLLHHLYILTHKPEYGEQAVKKYGELNESVPDVIYIERIRELEYYKSVYK